MSVSSGTSDWIANNSRMSTSKTRAVLLGWPVMTLNTRICLGFFLIFSGCFSAKAHAETQTMRATVSAYTMYGCDPNFPNSEGKCQTDALNYAKRNMQNQCKTYYNGQLVGELLRNTVWRVGPTAWQADIAQTCEYKVEYPDPPTPDPDISPAIDLLLGDF